MHPPSFLSYPHPFPPLCEFVQVTIDVWVQHLQITMLLPPLPPPLLSSTCILPISSLLPCNMTSHVCHPFSSLPFILILFIFTYYFTLWIGPNLFFYISPFCAFLKAYLRLHTSISTGFFHIFSFHPIRKLK